MEIICPSCRTPVLPKQGRIKQWHFAHARTDDCEYAHETELHLIAKASINIGDRFYLPELKDASEQILMPETAIRVDDVSIEHQLSNIKPDLVIVSKGHRLLVEIAVTHFIDSAKKRKIEDLGVSCLEIDLSSYRNDSETYSAEKIRNLVLNGIYRKQWVYHRFAEDLKQEKQQQQLAARKSHEKKINSNLIQRLVKPGNIIELDLSSLNHRRGTYYAYFEGEFREYESEKKFYLAFSYYNSLTDLQGAFLQACYNNDFQVDLDIMNPNLSLLRKKLLSIIKKQSAHQF